MNDYKFTKDWFNWAPAVWEQLIPHLPGEPGKRQFLEIGSFEGRSAVWIVENMMQDKDSLTCIDTWEGGEEHTDDEIYGIEDRFDHNLDLLQAKFPDRWVYKYKGTSAKELASLLASVDDYIPDYDFIYIDGSHIAKDVLTDACMAWQLLKPGGLMVFDDYMWGPPRDVLHRPKVAIDAFCNIFAETARIVHVGYQLVVRKEA